MQLAQGLIEAAAKQFREPEKQPTENGKCRSYAHHQVEMPRHKVFRDGSGSPGRS